jgi:eukaryotic-like serine/threonine-protein kinase
MRRPFINFFQIASLLLLLVAIALLSAVTTMHFAIHGAEVKVPALKQMTVADARSLTAGLGLTLEVDNRYYSADVAAGHILSQSPTPGSVVRREWHVRVAESLGPQKVEVPETVGLNERVASLQLRRVGLEVGTIVRMPYSGAAEGTVIAQDPPAKARGIESPSINLLVAAPGEELNDKLVMPSLVGLPVVTAQMMLERAGLKSDKPTFVDVPIPPVGTGDAPIKPPVVPGTVISQEPEAGAKVDRTLLVDLTVAK